MSTPPDILALLRDVAEGRVSAEDAAHSLAPTLRTDEGLALDLCRHARTGLPEVVFGPGKSPEQLAQALAGLASQGHGALATKVSEDQASHALAALPEATHWPQAGLVHVPSDTLPGLELDAPWTHTGDLLVVTAGAGDLPVALEALGAARFFGLRAGLVTDVGVAGLHRLGERLDTLRGATVLAVVAGMEGALPSVVGGLTSAPIIAVPTSVGYGASLSGVTAMLGMLTSCAPGVSVVNIDNGFGAAACAAKMLLGADR